MLDLTKRWPLGLGPRSWPLHLLGAVALLGGLAWFDLWAARAAINWPDLWRAPFFFITDYGLAEWVLVPTLFALLVALLAMRLLTRGLWRRAAFEAALLSGYLFVAVGAPGLVTTIVKRLVGRGRPEVVEAEGAFDFRYLLNDWTFQSFPSGHTTTAIAVAFAFGFLWPRLFPWLLVIGVAVGISRVPVGMHYPTDVFGGLLVGMLGAYGVRNAFAARRLVFVAHADGRIRARGFPALRRLVRKLRQRAAL